MTPTTTRTLTDCDRLLLAAWRIFKESGEPYIDLTSLVLAAWADNRDRFGLPGFATAHPSDNRVKVTLYQGSGPLKRGWLRRVRANVWAFTEAGAERVRELKGAD